MSLLDRQKFAAPQRGLPVEEKNGSATLTTTTGETVQFFYSNAGVRTQDAGQAAGVAVEAVLAKNNIKNSQGKTQATSADTSLSFTSTAFTTEVAMNMDLLETFDAASFDARLTAFTKDLADGEYRVDYGKGIIYGKKASTQTSLAAATYKTYAAAASGGGVSADDDGAFTPGTAASITPAGFFADETAPDSVNEGDVGVARMTLDRRILTAGQTTDDAAPETGTRANAMGALADETATDSVDEGDIGFVRMSLDRRLITSSEDTDDAAKTAGSKVAVIGGVMDDTSTDTVDEGDAGWVRITNDRNLMMTLGYLIAGEDQTNNVLHTRYNGSYVRITTAATTVVKAAAGHLRLIAMNTKVATGTVTLYDNTAGSGTIIGVITFGAALLSDQGTSEIFDLNFNTGLTIVTTGTMDLTVVYS